MALLTEGDVLKLIPVSKQTLKDWEREGIFPKSNANGCWTDKIVKQWIAENTTPAE